MVWFAKKNSENTKINQIMFLSSHFLPPNEGDRLGGYTLIVKHSL